MAAHTTRLRPVTGKLMRILVLETTSPFQSLPELVAFDEGRFARDGLDIRCAAG
jgi:hypothetical protein